MEVSTVPPCLYNELLFLWHDASQQKESENSQPTLSLSLPESELLLLLPEGSAKENKPFRITVRLPS